MHESLVNWALLGGPVAVPTSIPQFGHRNGLWRWQLNTELNAELNRELNMDCTICTHREHPAIDLGIARGVSVTALARRYKVSTDSLYRHKRAHLPPQIRAKLIAGPDTEIDLDRLRETESQSLLAHLVALRHRLFASLDVAEECGDSAMVARVAHQLHENLTITARLLGDLGVGGTSITNNVLIMPAYLELRQAITTALARFPEARLAVASALGAIEHKAAKTIEAEAGRPLFEAEAVLP